MYTRFDADADVDAVIGAMRDGQVQLKELRIVTNLFPANIGRMPSIKYLHYSCPRSKTSPEQLALELSLAVRGLKQIDVFWNLMTVEMIYNVLLNGNELQAASFHIEPFLYNDYRGDLE